MSASIYIVTNTVNNKIYIGKTKKSIQERFKEHKCSAKIGSSFYIHKAIRKYGEENFRIDLLEFLNDENLSNDREKFWISELSPDYNMTSGGEGGDYWKGKTFSEEHRYKLGNSFRGKKRPPMSIEQREKLRQANLGKKASTETKLKMSNSRKGVLKTPEHRAKLAAHLAIQNQLRFNPTQ